MQRIDIATPLATPFRPNWATAPRVDISFKTDVFTAAEEKMLFQLPGELRRDLRASGLDDTSTEIRHDAGALP